MMEITAEIRALIDKAAAGVELAGDEYIDPADGLIHCKKCGGQRQTVVPCFGKPGYFMPRCICQCQREAEEQRKAAEERQRRMERIKRRKAQGLQAVSYTHLRDREGTPRPRLWPLPECFPDGRGTGRLTGQLSCCMGPVYRKAVRVHGFYRQAVSEPRRHHPAGKLACKSASSSSVRKTF